MWTLLALVAGLGDALRDTASKRCTDLPSPLLVSWAYSLFMLPFVVPLLWDARIAELPIDFWTMNLLVASLHVLGGIILVKSLHAADLSIIIPLSAFSPVFLLFIGPIISGDSVTSIGVLGAVLVVIGAYLINLSKVSAGFKAPIIALVHNPGARGMLLLALLWSITGSIDRLAVQSFPLKVWAPIQMVGISTLFLPILIFGGHLKGFGSRKSLFRLFPIGAFNALSFIPYLFALQLAPVQYVVCIKRTSILFSLLLGRTMFGENALGERALGACLMFLGVVVISVFG